MKKLIWATLFIVLTGLLGKWPSQSDFAIILLLFTSLFVVYALLISSWKCSDKVIGWVATGLAARLILIFCFPQLSDDIYRFYWDAMLTDQGISPYRFLPAEISHATVANHREVFEMLNSKEYYSVYPPFNQLLFWISLKAGVSLYGFSIVLKVLYLAFEVIGVIYMLKTLKALGKSMWWGALYWLNPLVIMEGMGNLHIECAMVGLLSVSVYYYHKNQLHFKTALHYAASVALKITPLMLSPFLFFHQDRGSRQAFTLKVLILVLFLFLPLFILMDIPSFLQSLELYFRKFEFNAGIYYILRWVGFQISGYNLIAYIGPALILCFTVVVLWMSLSVKSRDTITLIQLWLVTWTAYLLLSTTVHPWYIIPILFLGSFSGFLYPVVWSYLITLTYINYSYNQYCENLWVVAIEYLLVGIFIGVEYFYYRKNTLA